MTMTTVKGKATVLIVSLALLFAAIAAASLYANHLLKNELVEALETQAQITLGPGKPAPR